MVAQSEQPSIVELDYPPASAAFQNMHCLIQQYILSFPKSHRDPMRHGYLDGVLYYALLLPYQTLVVLHSPHVNDYNLESFSAKECLAAARHILEYVYMLSNMSYDFGLLDPWCANIFFSACHEVMRATVGCARRRMWDEAWMYRGEVDVFMDALSRMSTRLPNAHRYHQALIGLYEKDVAPSFERRKPGTRPPAPVLFNQDDTAWDSD